MLPILLIILNIPLYVFLGKLFFGDWDGFWDTVRYSFTSDFLSALRGEYYDDFWAEVKLGVYLVTCGFCVWGEYALIERLLG